MSRLTVARSVQSTYLVQPIPSLLSGKKALFM